MVSENIKPEVTGLDAEGVVVLIEELSAKIKTLKENRDKFVQEANVQIGYFDGMIAANKELIKRLQNV